MVENSVSFFGECNSVRSGLQNSSCGSSVPLKLLKSILRQENDDDTFNYLHYSHQLYKV